MTTQEPEPVFEEAWQGGAYTSKLAMEQAVDWGSDILGYIQSRSWHGAIVNGEITEATGIPVESASPAVSKLKREGKIRKSGRTRPTVNGRKASVWIACDEPKPADETRFHLTLSKKAHEYLREVALKAGTTPAVETQRVLLEYLQQHHRENHPEFYGEEQADENTGTHG